MRTLKIAHSVIFIGMFLLVNSKLIASGSSSTFQKLVMVNAEWKNQKDVNPKWLDEVNGKGYTYRDWITQHLTLVIRTLENRSVEHLSTRQRANRKKLLHTLSYYKTHRLYPVNDYLSFKTPIFIDNHNNFCAVGYLMKESGYEKLARAIDKDNELAYVSEIKVQGVSEWAKEQGFTVDELAWIQPAYNPNTDVSPLDMGVNGPVYDMELIQSGNAMVVVGDFNVNNVNTPINDIAVWQNGIAGFSWTSLGSGTNGHVNCVKSSGVMLLFGGSFSQANGIAVQNIILYDLFESNWIAIPGLAGEVNDIEVFEGAIYACGNFPGHIAKYTGSSWTILNPPLTGEVRCLAVYDGNLVAGGDFDLATGAPRKHIIAFDGTDFTFLGLGTSNPVNTLEVHENKLFAGMDFYTATDTASIAVYEDYSWPNVFSPNYLGFSGFVMGNSINKLRSMGGNLWAAGDFTVANGLNYGNNLSRIEHWYDEPGDTIGFYVTQPIALFDGVLHSLSNNGNVVFTGGDFTAANYTDTVNNICTFEMVTSVDEKSKEVSVQLFPNPSSNRIELVYPVGYEVEQLNLYDFNGRLIRKENIQQKKIDVSGLNAGMYFYEILFAKGAKAHVKFVKQ